MKYTNDTGIKLHNGLAVCLFSHTDILKFLIYHGFPIIVYQVFLYTRLNDESQYKTGLHKRLKNRDTNNIGIILVVSSNILYLTTSSVSWETSATRTVREQYEVSS